MCSSGALFISEATVKTHVLRIFDKLGDCGDRAWLPAVAWGVTYVAEYTH
jgi:hypothetical protein